jgi:hypothetical protein
MEFAVVEEKERRRKDRILQGLIDQLPSGSFQKNPYFPNLLNQPDVLVAPEPGRIVAVFLYNRRLTWRSALASLEDLFEAKLYLGRHTVAVAYDLSESSPDLEEEDMKRLLQNTFDLFSHLDFGKSDIRGGRFRNTVLHSTPRQNPFHLWDMEKEFVQAALRRFSKERYQALVDREHFPTRAKEALVRQTGVTIEDFTGTLPERNPLVESVKGSLGSLSGRYKLDFDLMALQPIEVPIEIVRVGRYGSRDTVRYLMTKARLMRYSGEKGQLERVWEKRRPLLIVEGNLAGPDHDPFRYVRSLVSVGWEVMSADEINQIQRVLADATLILNRDVLHSVGRPISQLRSVVRCFPRGVSGSV